MSGLPKEIHYIFENITELDYEKIAQAVLKDAKTGDIIVLDGDLGMGKTSFARALIQCAADDKSLDVPSPTYNLVQSYLGVVGTIKEIWHFDLYRLKEPAELLEVGIEEALDIALSLVEWAENGGEYLPMPNLTIRFEETATPDTRRLTIFGEARWQALNSMPLPKVQ